MISDEKQRTQWGCRSCVIVREVWRRGEGWGWEVVGFITVDGRFGHGRFGLGRFGLGRFGHGRFGQAIFKGGRFGQIYIFRRFI